MRISEHVTRSMVCRYEFIRRVPFHLRGEKKKSKKKERYGSLDELKLVVDDIDIAGRSLIVADVGAERRHRNGP